MHAPLAGLVPADSALADPREHTELLPSQLSSVTPSHEIQPWLGNCLHPVDIMSAGLQGQPA
jgi:hypothetical protein